MTVAPVADGPDVSHYQHLTGDPVPAWPLFSCKLTEGRGGHDQTAPQWLALMNHLAVDFRGVYHWLRPDSPMVDQAANVLTRLRQLGLIDADNSLHTGYFIQTDWERTPNLRWLTVAEVEEFNDRLHQMFGDRVITYSSDWVEGFTEWRDRNPTAALWYANYNLTNPTAGGPAECAKYRADVWQWTSKFKGRGIASGTPGQPATDTGYDMNQILVHATLERLCKLIPPPSPVPAPAPAPVHTTAAFAAATGGDMPLRIIARKNPANPTEPEGPTRWVTNGLVRTIPTEQSLDYLTRTGQVAVGTIRNPELLDDYELAGLPLVGS